MRASLVFTLGALLMAAVADPTPAQEPKGLFKEVVKFEKLNDAGEPVYTLDNAPAYRGGTGKGQHWAVQFSKIRTDGPFKSVRITDKDGKVYKSTKVKGPENAVLRIYHDAPVTNPAP